MKRGVIMGGVIGVAVLAGGLFWFSSALFSSGIPAGQEAAVSAAGTKEAKFSALVTPIATQVFTSPSGEGAQFAELATTTSVGEGTRVKTSQSGRALIEGSHEAFLDYDTEIVIASADAGKGTHIDLEGGKIWARVKNVARGSDTYEIKTPNAVAVVRGTSFGLYYKGNKTTLLVTEGEVRLSAVDTETGEVVPDTEVSVGPGEKAVREADDPIVETVIEEEDKADDWFEFDSSDESGETAGDTEPETKNQPAALTPRESAPVDTLSPNPPVSAVAPMNAPTEANSPPLGTRPPPPSGEPLSLEKLAPSEAESANLPNIPIDVYGSGLDAMTGLVVGDYVVRDFTVVDHMHARFYLPRGFAPGIYTIGATDKAGKHSYLYDALDIYDKRAPALDGGG